jgi:hypothetical protein
MQRKVDELITAPAVFTSPSSARQETTERPVEAGEAKSVESPSATVPGSNSGGTAPANQIERQDEKK